MKNWRLNTLLVMAVVLVMGLGTQTAQATGVTLGELIDTHGRLLVDDKIFSNFSAIQTGSLSTNADDLVVTGAVIGPRLDELTFSGLVNGGCATCPAGSGDVTIDYTVSTANGAPLIHDILLSFNGIVVTPTASVTVTEDASVGGVVVGQVHVQNPPQNLTDYTVLSGGPYSSVSVSKDIAIT